MASDARRALIALMLLGAAAACREDVSVSVMQDARGVAFAPEPAGKCIRSAYVYGDGSDQPVWSAIDGRVNGACTRSVRYGVKPAGLGGEARAPTLQPGRRYRVALVGAGFNASAQFERR